MKIHRLPALETNIFYLLEEDGKALIFDPGDADVLQSFLKEHNLKPEAIWLTHHHWDHINGVEQLKSHYDIPVYSSVFDSKRLSFVDHGLKAG
ncbi:MAG TPA: hydroxyacylglutathione hydrolase, partial [Bdellovibrionales bacterium]|nr:hydroxyacylglutathione hydrolase [Bdellovibrionales bacterium]